jgi:hypothetical protein
LKRWPLKKKRCGLYYTAEGSAATMRHAGSDGMYTADDAARALLRALRAAAEPPTLLLTARDAARALSISEKTLWSLTEPRGPIPMIRVGERSIRYSVVALEKWIAEAQTSAVELSNEPFGDGARLVPATGYSPDRARSDSAALQSQKKTPDGITVERNCDRLLT